MKAGKGLIQLLVLRTLARFTLRFSPSSLRKEDRSSKKVKLSHLRHFSARGFLEHHNNVKLQLTPQRTMKRIRRTDD